jgi:pentatricopeptide repeat protein
METVYGFPGDSNTYNSLLALYGQSLQYDKMWRLFRLMEGKQPPMPSSSNNTPEEALFTHVARSATCVVPDMMTYNILFAAMARPAGENGRAEMPRLLEDMKRHGLTPSGTLYCAVMSHHVAMDECERANELFREAKEGSEKLPFSLFVVAMRSRLKRRDQIGVLAIWKEMIAAGIEPDERAYNILLQTHASKTNPNEKQIALVVAQMKEKEFAFDTASYHLLMHAYTKLKDSEKVIEIHQHMLQDPVSEAKVDPFCVTAVLLAYTRLHNLESACEMYQKLVDMRATIRSSVFTALLALCHRKEDSMTALKVYNAAKARDVRLGAKDYAELIQLFASSPLPEKRDQAHAFLMEMKERGLNCPRWAWAALVRLYAQRGELDVMMTMFEWMKLDAAEEHYEREVTASDDDAMSEGRRRINPLAKEKEAKAAKPVLGTLPATVLELPLLPGERIPFRLFLVMLRACVVARNLSVAAHLFREIDNCRGKPLHSHDIGFLCGLFTTSTDDETFLKDLARHMESDPVVSNSVILRVMKHYVSEKHASARKQESVS